MSMNLIIDDFEGPMDLLLSLIKEKKMDILNLKLELVIDLYLEYIEKMEEMNLNVASSYLVMASELIEIKSRMLLPRYHEEDEDPIEVEFVDRLIEYQRYKDLSDEFKRLESSRKEIFTKLPDSLCEYQEGNLIKNGNLSIEDLVDAFQKFLDRKKDEEPLLTKVTGKELSVDKRIISIRNIIKNKKKVNFFELFEELNKEFLIVTFLAILEMAKNNEITIRQEERYGNITCEVYHE